MFTPEEEEVEGVELCWRIKMSIGARGEKRKKIIIIKYMITNREPFAFYCSAT